ncbi:hypothetical protein HGRIS_002669 [Hohenbuehelia grisea]|uniref:Uncharacterized protein n=1 Tax=Hohenbuehelia grisea TaxID=104357 RepID=A0ABR3JML3_9AGAR
MKNAAKKLTGKPSMSITDFFVPKSSPNGKSEDRKQKPSQSTPTSAKPSAPAKQTPKDMKTRSSSRPEPAALSSSSKVNAKSAASASIDASKKLSKTRQDIDSATVTQRRRSSRLSQPPSTPAGPSSSTSSRTLDTRIAEEPEPSMPSLPKPATNLKSSSKRKIKLDDDASDVELLDKVVCRTKTSKAPVQCLPPNGKTSTAIGSTASRKRPRLTSPERSTPSDIVPSSQSGELELAVPGRKLRDSDAVKENVDKWRQESMLPSSPLTALSSEPDAMAVDFEDDPLPSFSSPSPSSEAPTEVGIETSFSTPSVPDKPSSPLFTPATPSSASSFALPLPKTPVALDPASKAAQIIARIKARAIAEAESSPEPPAIDIDQNSDSDEEPEYQFGAQRAKPSLATEREPVPMPVASGSSEPRYNLRNQGGPSGERASATDSKGKGKAPARRSPAASFNPINAMLKEKRLADRKGKGSEALHQAEIALAKHTLLSEMDDENEDDWDDPRLAFETSNLKSRASAVFGASSDQLLMDDKVPEKLLGEKSGQAIAGILRRDREGIAEAAAKLKVVGVPLWSPHNPQEDVKMGATQSFAFGTGKGDPAAVKALADALQADDIQTARLLIQVSLGGSLSHVVPLLCQLALAAPLHDLGDPAFTALQTAWNPSSPRSDAGLPSSLIGSTLVALGAQPQILASNGLSISPAASNANVNADCRDKIVFRLVYLMEISSRYGKNAPKDVAGMIIALLLIALDPSCSETMQQHIAVAIHHVCESLGPSDSIDAALESVICTRVLGLMSGLAPINKAFVLGLISAGSGRSKRIARVIAYSTITGESSVPAKKYDGLPPILRLAKPLLPLTASEQPDATPDQLAFQIRDTTDYVDMGFYTEILGIAISDVEVYAVREARMGKVQLDVGAPMGSPGRVAPEKLETPLQLLRNAIEAIHSRIADTRAAHLDRSRTKAALKQLSMRIHYQRQDAIKSVKGNGKIQSYFAPRGAAN